MRPKGGGVRGDEKASRHYASMVIDGDDLVVLSRSGDEQAKSPHDGNLITVHRVKAFRKLAAPVQNVDARPATRDTRRAVVDQATG